MRWEESEVEAEGAGLSQCQLEQDLGPVLESWVSPSSSSAQLCQTEEEVELCYGGLEI